MSATRSDGELPQRPRILLVDDDLMTLAATKVPLLKHGYDVTAVTSGEVALGWLDRQTPDVVLLDIVLPGISGFEICRRLRERPDTANVPVIFLTVRASLEAQAEAQRVGGDLYLVKPADIDRLLFFVQLLLQSPPRGAKALRVLPETMHVPRVKAPPAPPAVIAAAGRKRVLLVDDEAESLEVTKVILEHYGYEVVTAACGLDALELLARERPDLVLLDILLPDVSGFEICRRMRREEPTMKIPVICLSGKLDSLDAQIEARLAGSDVFLGKPIQPDRLIDLVGRCLQA
jgi:two-component system, cell cycle response regulator